MAAALPDAGQVHGRGDRGGARPRGQGAAAAAPVLGENRPWGLPTGGAKRGETFEETVAREVREETGLEVRVGELVQLRSGFRLRMEVAYAAVYEGGGTLRLNSMEILEARWCDPGDLPEGLIPSHRALIEATR
ncbi:NUDIX domain-containing protein [Nonomuraea sp. N2-4H]|uniref:NUDIX domain-containing protein n=1 Tax=Nonomuraea sp. N2-4H TaxID=3128898 RepID=UPI00325400E8